MNIAQQLAEKYPGIFDPLIEAYEKSIFGDRVNTRPRKIIEKLLDRDGEIISMYLQGESLEGIADRTELSTEEIQKILKTYDKRNVTQFGLSEKALSFRAERIQNAKIEELREKIECLAQRHPGVFEPLIDIGNNIAYDDIETYKRISKVVKSLSNDKSNHGEILSLRYEGFSLQEIGDKFTITRERVRQIIKKYDGLYTVAGTQEWCWRQLDKLSDPQKDIRIFPSNQELNACHLKLSC